MQVLIEAKKHSQELEDAKLATEQQKEYNAQQDNMLVATLRKHYDAVSTSNKTLEQKLDETDTNNAVLQESLDAAATQLEDYNTLQQRVTQFQAEVVEANKRTQAEAAQVEGLRNELAHAQSTTDDRQKTLAEMHLVLKALTNHNEQLENALAAAEEAGRPKLLSSPQALESRSRHRRAGSNSGSAIVAVRKSPANYKSPVKGDTSFKSPVKGGSPMTPLEQHAVKQLAKRARQLGGSGH